MYMNIPHAHDVEGVRQSIETMMAQESSVPQTPDYMAMHESQVAQMIRETPPVDQECRHKMAEWCFQVVDFCSFNRSTAAYAIGYLDRYLATKAGPEVLSNRKLFQLASMTCLYTAIKIHEPEAMESKIVAELSRGTYNEEQVCEMERSILANLQWRLFLPTAREFCHHMLAFTDMTEGSPELEEILKVAIFQTELAVNNCDLCRAKPSSVAFASLSNAMKGHPQILESISYFVSVDFYEVQVVRSKLQELMKTTFAPANSRYNEPSPKTQTNAMANSNNIHSSPRGVVTGAKENDLIHSSMNMH